MPMKMQMRVERMMPDCWKARGITRTEEPTMVLEMEKMVLRDEFLGPTWLVLVVRIMLFLSYGVRSEMERIAFTRNSSAYSSFSIPIYI